MADVNVVDAVRTVFCVVDCCLYIFVAMSKLVQHCASSSCVTTVSV